MCKTVFGTPTRNCPDRGQCHEQACAARIPPTTNTCGGFNYHPPPASSRWCQPHARAVVMPPKYPGRGPVTPSGLPSVMLARSPPVTLWAMVPTPARRRSSRTGSHILWSRLPAPAQYLVRTCKLLTHHARAPITYPPVAVQHSLAPTLASASSARAARYHVAAARTIIAAGSTPHMWNGSHGRATVLPVAGGTVTGSVRAIHPPDSDPAPVPHREATTPPDSSAASRGATVVVRASVWCAHAGMVAIVIRGGARPLADAMGHGVEKNKCSHCHSHVVVCTRRTHVCRRAITNSWRAPS